MSRPQLRRIRHPTCTTPSHMPSSSNITGNSSWSAKPFFAPATALFSPVGLHSKYLQIPRLRLCGSTVFDKIYCHIAGFPLPARRRIVEHGAISISSSFTPVQFSAKLVHNTPYNTPLSSKSSTLKQTITMGSGYSPVRE